MSVTNEDYKTEEEAFWAGDFGNDYIQRNQDDALIPGKINLLADAMRGTRDVKTCIEFGSNVGLNIKALKILFPRIKSHAIEINSNAVNELSKTLPRESIFNTSILDWSVPEDMSWDMAMINGVLIHINPDMLPLVYDKLVNATSRYLLVNEYYNPTPVAIDYRGHSDKLYKSDFAGEIMDRHSDMKLVDYGFKCHCETNYIFGDGTWFLMEKRS
jgi:pseudaminic acid biosynthesis-associated methylase